MTAACCPESRLCEGGCNRVMCEDHGLQPTPTCGSHVECIDCSYDSPCRQCAKVRRELEDDESDRRWEDHQDRIAAALDERDDAMRAAIEVDREAS